MEKPLLIVVVGATAIGKTALAIKIATAFETEILSADSRQFYKEMRIGTAVPSEIELASVPHHFIQNKSIFETYTVGDFETEALAKLAVLFQNKKTAVLVGGSGLYVDAVTKGLDSFPKVPSEIRETLNKELQTFGIEKLQTELKEIDASYAKTIDVQNPRRLIRALEVYRASGKPYASFLRDEDAQRPFEILYIGLKADRELMYNRINARVDIMMGSGLLNEAKTLFKHKELNALQTVGYRELFQHLDGTRNFEEAISEIKKNTRRFSKRQITWFKKNEAIHWFDYDSDIKKIIDFIKQKTP